MLSDEKTLQTIHAEMFSLFMPRLVVHELREQSLSIGGGGWRVKKNPYEKFRPPVKSAGKI